MSLPNGPIVPIDRHDVADRADVRLPVAWVETGHGPLDLESVQTGSGLVLAERALDTVDGPANDAASVILYGSSGADDLGRLEALLRAVSTKTSRVYVLADRERLTTADAGKIARNVGGRILFRRAEGVPCTALLCERGARAGVYLGDGPSPTWWTALTPDQGAALFRAALHLFWHEAEDEGWLDGKAFKFEPPMDRPFDAPTPARGEPIHFTQARPPTPGPIVYRPGDAVELQSDMRAVLTPPDGTHLEQLAGHVDGVGQVVWSDLGLPAFSLWDHRGWLTLGTGPWQLTVELSDAQRAALTGLVQSAGSTPEWRLARSVPLGALDHRVWLPGRTSPAQPDDDVRLSCGTVKATSIRETPAVEPASRPEPPVLGRQVTWTWRVAPPRLPKKSKIDPLESQWKAVDADYAGRCAAVATALKEAETYQGTLGRTLDRLKRALLGFGRAHKRHVSTLDELQQAVPSAAGPSDARALLSRLGELEQHVDEHSGALKKAEADARREIEKEKQERAHERKQDEARASLGRERTALTKARDALTSVQQDLEALKAKDAPSKDDRARMKKLKNDKQKAEKALRIAESGIERAQKTLDTPFEFKPPKTSIGRTSRSRTTGSRFVPGHASSPKAVDIPEDALPAVGRLRRVGDVRYLAIDAWTELDTGEEEAGRLKARLVAGGGG